VSVARGDIIFFLDDDVVLFHNYIEEILGTYISYDSSELAGVGGLIENTRRNWWHIYDVFFMISGWREGRIMRSGFATVFGEVISLKNIVSVDFLMGGVCSYKKWVFNKFKFSETYKGYGQGEDKDFSYRVSRAYKLLINPKARLYHYHSPQMRHDQEKKGEEYFYERYNFFINNALKHRWEWIFFTWASFGYILKRVIIMVGTFDKDQYARVKGILKGLRNVLINKTCEE
jgi:GT2 family glycosyltransferase